jgi:hypothetical protein
MWMSDFLLARLCKLVTKSCVLNSINDFSCSMVAVTFPASSGLCFGHALVSPLVLPHCCSRRK